MTLRSTFVKLDAHAGAWGSAGIVARRNVERRDDYGMDTSLAILYLRGKGEGMERVCAYVRERERGKTYAGHIVAPQQISSGKKRKGKRNE